MAKSNGFLGKSCAGFAGCESAHGARAHEHGQRHTSNGEAMWALANRAAMWFRQEVERRVPGIWLRG
jgi:hypothetical protein